MMAVEIMIARQLTYFAARQKDSGKRCDLEAGMAKLLAARVAWANADNAVQIHGGNGFALEFPISRILCDARILSIFEGAAEIQAQVIARRLLSATELTRLRRTDSGAPAFALKGKLIENKEAAAVPRYSCGLSEEVLHAKAENPARRLGDRLRRQERR